MSLEDVLKRDWCGGGRRYCFTTRPVLAPAPDVGAGGTAYLDCCRGERQGLDDGFGDVLGVGVASDVAGQVAGAGGGFDGGFDAAGFLVQAEVVQHQGSGGDGADRVADALAASANLNR